MDIAAALALTGEGYSRRRIARMLGVSRNTLRKYLSDGVAPAHADGGKLERYLGPLSQMLSEAPQARAMEIHRKLAAMGYSGSYDLVKRKVRAMRNAGPADAGAPVPGEMAEADLGRVQAGGRTLWLFTLSLEYSGRIFAELSERADLDAFLEWHARGFRYFQGVPARIAYDKTRNRYVKAYVGGTGVNLPLARFAAHHGFTPIPAKPFHPWAAGRLKRPLRMIETLFLKGYPLQTVEGANPALLGWLLGREGASGSGSAKDRFSLEQSRLLPLPKTGFPRFRPKLQEKPAMQAGGAGSVGPDFPEANSWK
jgi:transposase